MKAIFPLLFLLFFAAQTSVGQIIGGRTAMPFLLQPASARIAALGGAPIALKDGDAALGLANPASLSQKTNGQLAFAHNFHVADVQNGAFAFSHFFKKQKLATALGFRYMDFGTIKEADELGAVTGEFRPKESAVSLMASREIYDRLTVGASVGFASSRLGAFNSSALVGDLAAIFEDTSSRFTAAIVLKNMGGQLDFYGAKREKLPFDLQIGFSKRLRHLPFRLSVTGQQLHRRNLVYDDPNVKDDEFLLLTGTDQSLSKSKTFQTLDNFFRHLVFGGEFLLGKNEGFRLRFGYDHLRHRLMTVPNLRSMAGFSAGLGIKVSRFRIDYGYSSYHLAGGASHLSLSARLGDFF